MILDTFPSAEEFYKTYWGKKPFIVRKFIDPVLMESFVDGDIMAGLALEEDIKSRIVTNDPSGRKWECEHGPFDESRFSELGERDWSLLVQNVEQYHTDTAKLLEYFHFSPRWLLDDIMVSYSAPGGSVGPHTDSYHTFLIQGIGVRKWKLSADPVMDKNYIQGMDIKVLQNGFKGDEFEVRMGDVIYIPPHFGHEGVTLETAMTFSVGFLGPKMSEMMTEYAAYLEEVESRDKRYLGAGLGVDSGAFSVSLQEQDTIRNGLISAIQSDDFSLWMAQYFSTPTYADIEDIELCADPLDEADILDALQKGSVLYRPEHIKLSITTSSNGALHLAVYGQVVSSSLEHKALIESMNCNETISRENLDDLGDRHAVITLITQLYNLDVLSFEGHDG
ncbi:MAG: hypothetical protein COA45_08075 [Zetaproteobacteria bacterium]|nr:MAG: hypothetical protein COA45_08075 [Zetaproteobacteria bacterium]